MEEEGSVPAEDGSVEAPRPGAPAGMFQPDKLRILASVGGGILALDIATKWAVQETFFLGRSVPVVGDVVRLTYVLNPGAAFGLHAGDHSRVVFTALGLVILTLLLRFYRVTPADDRFRLGAIAMVCGGALGNLLDRLAHPFAVVDFLDVGIGALRWPVFNVADVAITSGALLLALSFWSEEVENESAGDTDPEAEAPDAPDSEAEARDAPDSEAEARDAPDSEAEAPDASDPAAGPPDAAGSRTRTGVSGGDEPSGAPGPAGEAPGASGGDSSSAADARPPIRGASPPGQPSGRRSFRVPPSFSGGRLDVYLSGEAGLSRTRVARLTDQGRVWVDGEVPKKSQPVEAGQLVEIEVPEPEPLSDRPQDLPIDVVYEDAALAVVNKAAGMVVHPSAGHPDGTLVNALLHHVGDLSGIGGALRPGIVHRLDRDTSGLLVVAKHDRAHQALSAALKSRKIRRRYLAASWGHLAESPLTVDAPIGRDPANRKRMAVVPSGRRAVTRMRVKERWQSAELLEVALQTGRTHQIRVHLERVGHPVVGDVVYGAGWERGMGGSGRAWARELAARTPRHFLHAAELAFEHPETGRTMAFRAPLPEDLADVAAWARETSGA